MARVFYVANALATGEPNDRDEMKDKTKRGEFSGTHIRPALEVKKGDPHKPRTEI